MKNKIRQSALLFSGTAIGAGMLALPIASGASGFVAAMTYMLFWCLYSTATMFLILECIGYQKSDKDNGFLSMSYNLSGPVVRFSVIIFYMLLLYAVTSAYVIGGGQLFFNVLNNLGIKSSLFLSSIFFSGFFAIVSMQRIAIASRINQFLMYVLIISFVAMLINLVVNINFSSLTAVHDLDLLLPATSIIVLSFTCHNLLPSILEYLDGDFEDTRKSIFLGMCMPLAIYILWNAVVIGSLPIDGDNSILYIQTHHAKHGGELSMLAQALGKSGKAIFLDKLFMIFGLCAIVTSYVGVMISLRDFLIQGVNLASYKYKNVIATFLVYLPSLIFALFFPYGFIMVLTYAGLIITYLFGIIPVLWVLSARKRFIKPSRYPSNIPNFVVVTIGLLSVFVGVIQVYKF